MHVCIFIYSRKQSLLLSPHDPWVSDATQRRPLSDFYQRLIWPVLELPLNGISTTCILPASAFPAPRHIGEIHPYWSVVAFEGRAFPSLPLVFISRLLRLPISVRGKDTTLCKFLKLEAESCVDTSDGAVRGTRRRGRAAAARRARASLPPAAV